MRHYDDYSPTHSPARYSRSGQKFPTEQYNSSSRKSNNYNRYGNNNNEYYDSKLDQVSSSNSYYQHRRSPDSAFLHPNHNRSYSPSPSSSVDYCVDNSSRYNLTANSNNNKRYRQTSKDYRTSRSKIVADVHDGRNNNSSRYERTSENRSWNKSNRYDYDGYTKYRSKSGSRSRLSGSNSPHSHNSLSQQRNYRNESDKKSRPRKTNNNPIINNSNNNNNIDPVRLSAQKTNQRAISNIKLPPSNYNSKINHHDSSVVALTDAIKSTLGSTSAGSNTTASQSADTLSKLERERAKLLQELSMLSEEASIIGTTSGGGNSKSMKPIGKSVADQHATRSGSSSQKSQKKRLSPRAVDMSGGQSVKRVRLGLFHWLHTLR